MRYNSLLLLSLFLFCNMTCRNQHQAVTNSSINESTSLSFPPLLAKFKIIEVPLECNRDLDVWADIHTDYIQQYFRPETADWMEEDWAPKTFGMIGSFQWFDDFIVLLINDSTPSEYTDFHELFVMTNEGKLVDSLIVWRETTSGPDIAGIINKDRSITITKNDKEKTYIIDKTGHFIEK